MSYDDENPYEGYDPGGITPQELLARLMSLQRRITSTISLVERNGTDTRERQAQFVIELDAIKASVLDITEDLNGLDVKYAELKVEAEEILASVSRYVEQLDGVEDLASQISVRADGIESTVSRVASDLATFVETAESSISQVAGEIALKAEASVVTDIGGRVSTTEQTISALNGSISSKVSYSDYNGNTIATLINQTALDVTIAASKINMIGITEVAETLYIGGNFRDSGEKAIQFRGGSGGVYIGSPSRDTLRLSAISGITMDSWVYFTRSVDFSGATVTGLTVPFATNAGTVGGLSSNAFPHLQPHQYGANVSFAGNGDMTWVVNGNSFTYRRV